jgi:hypothetical protein
VNARECECPDCDCDRIFAEFLALTDADECVACKYLFIRAVECRGFRRQTPIPERLRENELYTGHSWERRSDCR